MKTIICVAALAIGGIAAVPASATTINFDSAPSSFTSYTESGVTFTAQGQSISTLAGPGGPTELLSQGSPRAPITAAFSAVKNGSFSIDLGDFDSDPDLIFLELYNSSNTLLTSSTLLLSDTDSVMHTLTAAANGVSYAIFGSRAPSLNGSSVYADNFTFPSAAAVPEPTSWAMMLAGFGALGCVMRRRRTTAVTFA